MGNRLGVRKSPIDGTVLAIGKESITLGGADGKTSTVELHNYYPSARKTFTHDTPLIKVGDAVTAGQNLAHSNYVDKDGNYATGRNLRVAFMAGPQGSTFEDAISISESGRKKLSSSHLYGFDQELRRGVQSDKKKFISLFPNKFTNEQLEKFGPDGRPLPGVTLQPGDPVLLAFAPRTLRSRDAALGNLHKVMRNSFQDMSQLWEKPTAGVVTDSVKARNLLSVNVSTVMPAKVGDKISGRAGAKGVIGKVIDDDQMFKDAEGNPVDVIINPAALIGRVNPSMVYEALLGKVAKKTGKRYVLPQFGEKDAENPGGIRDFVEKELAKHGLTDKEDLLDPSTGRTVPKVLIGDQYFLKLEHQSESKISSKGDEGGSDQDDQPGGESKRIGNLQQTALLSHGACFLGAVNVVTEDGPMEISTIVGKRLPINVACADMETGRVYFRKVTDWMCKSVSPDEIVKVTTNAKGSYGVRNKNSVPHRSIRCTKGHNFFTPGGKKHAIDLTPGETVYVPGTGVLDWQKRLLIGTLMGDSSVDASGKLSCTHGACQKDYSIWKHTKLKNFSVSEPKSAQYVNNFSKEPIIRFALRVHSDIKKLRNLFYIEGKKRVPAGVVEKMGLPGIGVWFGDAGSCVCETGKDISGFRIHTNGFTPSEVEMLAEELKAFTGLPWRRTNQTSSRNNPETGKRKKYPILYLGNGDGVQNNKGAENLRKWIDLISPFLPPQFAYKLRVESCGQWWEDKSPCFDPMLEEVQVESVEPYELRKNESSLVYNITVEEFHNYFVHGVLVGNSAVIRDVQLYRGSSNPEMWSKIRKGEPLPPPKTPFIFNKFLGTLRGAGIRVDRKGSKFNILAMTDKDVDAMARHSLDSGETLDLKTGTPISGGLFDPAKFGGVDGTDFGKIELEERIPNPLMEEPIRGLLGLTKNKYRDVLAGKEILAGKTGPAAIELALSRINLSQAEKDARDLIRSGRKSKRDGAVKQLGFISGLQKSGQEPTEMMLSKVPVVPPAYRPISIVNGLSMVSDSNYLYRDLLTARDLFKQNKAELPDSELGDERLALYDSVKALQGLGDPIHPETRDKGVQGFLKVITGRGGPKCYDDNTHLLTENGWIPFPQYSDKTVKVATLNPETQEMQYQHPSEITHENYEGVMVHTKTDKLDLFVTENHEHYIEKIIKRGVPNTNKKKRLREVQPAGKVRAGDLAGKTARVQYVTAASRFVGRTPEYSFGGRKVDPLAFAEFVGWWIAEGWVFGYKNRCITLVQKADTECSDRIDDVMSRTGLKYCRRVATQKKDLKFRKKGYKTIHWTLYGADLSEWLIGNCGNGALNKRISPEILSWSQEHQLALLTSYLRGDGEKVACLAADPLDKVTGFNMSTVTANSGRFSTISPSLVNDIEQLSLQCGLGFQRKDTYHTDHEVWSEQYRCRIYGWNRVIVEYPDQTCKIENWKGTVHCVTVPNGLVFVKRNEKVSISGNSGIFLSKVISHPVNAVGRAVVVPDSELDMDEVGVPEEIAWTGFAPFTMGRMVRDGMEPQIAADHLEKRTPMARRYIEQEMAHRPVMLSRDPALHRFNIMGAYAKMVPDSDALHVSPLFVKPAGMDFDGDQSNVQIPVSEEAIREIKEKMMPSKNLFSIKDKKVHYLPSQEFIMGLNNATSPNAKKAPVLFNSREELMAAYKNRQIDLDTPVSVVAA